MIPALLLLALPLSSQDSALRETVYLSADRGVYVAGDCMWLSAFCVNASSGSLSSFSRIAYVELHSAEGTVQTAKIALDGGRGAGNMLIPNTLPTGNYRLFAYTAQGASVPGFDHLTGARTVSVFNTFSTARIEGGVNVVDEVPEAPEHPSAGTVRVARPQPSKLRISNCGPLPVYLSLSVTHDDGIPAPQSTLPGSHDSPASLEMTSHLAPEYEGEIVRARVTGTDSAGLELLAGKYAFMSSPGDGSGVYTSTIEPDGSVTFVTSNIYGEQDMFLEIEGVDKGNICHLELQRPFLDLPAEEIPPLALCYSYAGALSLRALGMQLENSFNDGLATPLPLNRQLIFDPRKSKSYKLDDYTRFPVMEELFTEFIPEVRIRRQDGKRELQVRAVDPTGNSYFTQGTALVLLDGIPVLDHEKILSYDPLLVRRIDISPNAYFLGIRSFRGVVNFVTYKGTLPGMQFEDNVRVVTFQGCSLPHAYTCLDAGAGYPDYRQTIFWHPLIVLAPGETKELDYKAPDYSGRFLISAEGLDAAGSSVCACSSFTE